MTIRCEGLAYKVTHNSIAQTEVRVQRLGYVWSQVKPCASVIPSLFVLHGRFGLGARHTLYMRALGLKKELSFGLDFLALR